MDLTLLSRGESDLEYCFAITAEHWAQHHRSMWVVMGVEEWVLRLTVGMMVVEKDLVTLQVETWLSSWISTTA